MKEQQSNYEKVFQQFQQWFLESNHEETAKKLGLAMDEEFLYVPFFHKVHEVHRRNGEIDIEGQEASVTERLLIMQHLHYYQKEALESTKMVPFREIKEAAVFESAYQKSALVPLVKAFSGRAEALVKAGLALGGSRERYGDASITLYAFPKIKLTYIFWDGDEEFPASANILFDNRIAQWIHGESVPVLASTGTEKLLGL